MPKGQLVQYISGPLSTFTDRTGGTGEGPVVMAAITIVIGSGRFATLYSRVGVGRFRLT